MSYARYYVRPRSSQTLQRSFTAGQKWVQVAIRGVDVKGKAIKIPSLVVEQRRGTFHLAADCVHEIYFSDHIIQEEELDSLEKPGQKSLQGDGIVFSPSLEDIAFWPNLNPAEQSPPPPPPPDDRFDIYRINP